jgi:hypothetical protein
MSRADSPLHGRMIFAYGAQRSGTWWLQRMLMAHPEVAGVPSETYLFELGIKPLLERFHHGLRDSQTVAEMYADREDLLDATRAFCDRAFAPYTEPGKTYLCERSPGHAKAASLIAEVYPDARLIHIIRDGRDVARSLAARSWGPGSIGAAAAEWRDSVVCGREPADRSNYLEVRYEALLEDLEGGLRSIYDWLELPSDPALLEQAVQQSRRPLNEDPKDPRVAKGKWRDHWSEDDLAEFDAEAGELLAELGYVAERPLPPAPPEPEPEPVRPSFARRVRGALRARMAPAPAPANAAGPEIGGALAVSQRIADDLLSALHLSDAEAIRSLVADDVTMRVVGGGETQRLNGSAAIAETLLADQAWSGEQQYGAAHPGSPTFTLVLRYADGWRTLCFEQREQQIRRLTLYRV